MPHVYWTYVDLLSGTTIYRYIPAVQLDGTNPPRWLIDGLVGVGRAGSACGLSRAADAHGARVLLAGMAGEPGGVLSHGRTGAISLTSSATACG